MFGGDSAPWQRSIGRPVVSSTLEVVISVVLVAWVVLVVASVVLVAAVVVDSETDVVPSPASPDSSSEPQPVQSNMVAATNAVTGLKHIVPTVTTCGAFRERVAR